MRQPISIALQIALSAALLLISFVPPVSGQDDSGDTADLILSQGRFYPVSSAGSVEGSLAIRDGRIVLLGSDAEARALAGPNTVIVDLDGRAVTPGLIDAHSHLSGLGDAMVQVDLVGTRSLREVVERVRQAAAGTPAGAWVRGRGWDQNDWRKKEFPRHAALSAAVPDHPVWITRIDGHAALLNERAMAELGVGSEIEDPAGGRFLRDPQGRPTGVLVDNAMGVVAGKIPGLDLAERRRRLGLAARYVASLGLTTVTDMGVLGPQIVTYREMEKAGELPIRVSAFLADDPGVLSQWLRLGPLVDPEQRLHIRGVKLYADGALGSRGAALIEPYSDDPGNLGLLTSPGEHLRVVARRAYERGFQIAVHAIGDRGVLVTLDALEYVFRGQPHPELRFRLEHAQVMRLVDIERTARLGVIFSYQPTHATSDMPWALDRVGRDRLAGAYAWRKAIDAGGRLALGSDFPVESPDPRLGLYAAVTRQDLDGKPAGGWLRGERLTRAEALEGFTLGAAYALFMDDEVGSIEVGKRADLVVYDRDIMTVPEAEIPRTEIDLTLVNGEIVYRREAAR